MRPSIEVASFRATNGRSLRVRLKKNGAFCAAASASSRPDATAIPPWRSTSRPPRARASGSRMAQTTRATPAAAIASVHGGVLPWWVQGSRLTISVAPRAAAPAAASAAISACGPPNSRAIPHPPAVAQHDGAHKGFGATRPQPRHASSTARRIASRSAAVNVVPSGPPGDPSAP
jgi:hypothetical protein